MIKYKKFRLPGNSVLRVKADNIIATISSKDQTHIDLYVAGLANPFHLPVADHEIAHEIMDNVWERHTDTDVDLED